MTRIFSILTLVATMALAVEPKTAKEHLNAAKKLEAQALTFEQKAQKLEAEADALHARRESIPMNYKWPGMVQGMIDKARAQALQARRAAQESRAQVAVHRAQAAKLSNTAD